MSRADLTTIMPNQLYQRGRFLTWPASQKWAMLDRYKIDTVVNMWSKVDPDLSSERHGTLYLNWHTSPSEVPLGADRMIGFLSGLLSDGHVMLVHCEAGHGRSVWLCAALLVRHWHVAPRTAFELLDTIVPGMDVRPELLTHLEGMTP